MTCAKDKCIHREYCQRHIGQQEDGCVLYQRDNSPMTNEEYLRSCDTEQLATFLAIVQYDGTDLTLKKNHVEKWVEWLKEKHQ